MITIRRYSLVARVATSESRQARVLPECDWRLRSQRQHAEKRFQIEQKSNAVLNGIPKVNTTELPSEMSRSFPGGRRWLPSIPNIPDILGVLLDIPDIF